MKGVSKHNNGNTLLVHKFLHTKGQPTWGLGKQNWLRKNRPSEIFLIIETEDRARFNEQLCIACLGVFVIGILHVS